MANRIGMTPPAYTKRMNRVEREWSRIQGVEAAAESATTNTAAASAIA